MTSFFSWIYIGNCTNECLGWWNFGHYLRLTVLIKTLINLGLICWSSKREKRNCEITEITNSHFRPHKAASQVYL